MRSNGVFPDSNSCVELGHKFYVADGVDFFLVKPLAPLLCLLVGCVMRS